MSEKEKTFIIYPVHRQYNYKAPAIAVEATKYETAKELAMKQSRLSAWPDKCIFM